MITRQNGRKTFYQWDLDQKLVLTDIEGELDVHFWQEGQNEALVVTPTTEGGLVLVDVPNILLQNALPLKIYIWRKDTGAWTAHQQIFQVLEREKPYDYVYTETEVRTYEALDERITKLEKNGGSGTTDYSQLENKPKINGVELSGDKTLAELGIIIPSLDNYYNKGEIDNMIGDIETLLGGI